ncbi:MAG: hypothetical protein IT220_06170 [Flavobacteriaceae bacterium]|nr:hypothetical protein [Flavobacteriaceae bacterium]
MNNLTTPNLFNYRHGEFLQFMKNVLKVYGQVDTATLSLADKASKLETFTRALDEVFQPQMAQELTPELSNLDLRRDKALMGIKIYIDSQTYREESERVMAAQNLFANYISHGERIDKLSYQQETAVIQAMLQDWREGNLLAATQVLDLTSWIDLLNQLNKEFDEKYVKRAQEAPQPAEMDQKRLAIKSAYEDLTMDTVAFSRVAADREPYLNIIKSLNGLIDDYNLAVTQRLAGRGTDTEGVQPETPTPSEG